MTISNKKQWEIVFWQPTQKVRECLMMRLQSGESANIDTVKKCVRRYQETGDVEEKSKPRRKRSTSTKQDNLILSIVESHSDESLPKIYQRLKRQVVTCSMSTVRNCLKQASIKRFAPLKNPLLNKEH